MSTELVAIQSTEKASQQSCVHDGLLAVIANSNNTNCGWLISVQAVSSSHNMNLELTMLFETVALS